MPKNNILKTVFSLDVLLIVFALSIGIFPYFFHIFHGLFGVWIVLSVYFLIYGIIFKRFKLIDILKLDFISLSVFVLIVFINFYFRDTNDKSYSYFLNFFTFIILYVVDKTSIQYEKKITIFYLLLLGLGIQAAISIPYLLNEGVFVIRKLSRGELPSHKIQELRRNGVGNNALYSSVSAYIIFGIFLLQKIDSKFYKRLLILSLIAMTITVLMSTFLASILLLVFGLTIIYLFRFRSVFSFKNMIAVLVLIMGLVFFIKEHLSQTRFLEPVLYKIHQFYEGESDVTGRGTLAQASWESFKSDPFVGVGIPPMRTYTVIGEHMPWVDYLAHFGLFGYFPFLVFIFFRIRNRFKGVNIFKTDELICFTSVIVCILANFISPMFTSSVFFIAFIYIFTSETMKVKK